jgi:hypothetical protein
MTDSLPQRRLRRDVTRWARELGFTPQMAVENPEAIIDFMDQCLERFPDQYSLEHASEIFRWCKEHSPYPHGVLQ